MKFISDSGLKELNNYKYVGGEYSWLDKKLNPYWIKLSEFLPIVKYKITKTKQNKNKQKKTLAPNTVTLIGFLFIVSQYIIMLTFDVTISK